MTAERVQRELAEVIEAARFVLVHSPDGAYGTTATSDDIAAALLPTVQALIAAELRVVADNVRKQAPGYIGRIDTADSIDDRAAALAPPGKQEVNQKR